MTVERDLRSSQEPSSRSECCDEPLDGWEIVGKPEAN